MSSPSNHSVIAFPEAEVSLLDAYLRGLPSDPTRRVYRRAVKSFDAFLGNLDLHDATRRDVEAYRAHREAEGRAAATVAKEMSALFGYYEFAVDEGVVARNPVARARRPKLPQVSHRRGLSAAEVRALMAVPDLGTAVGLRDRVLLLLLAVQAWRISEVLALRVEDIDEEGGHRVAVVRGKGGKVLRVPLAAATWSAITDWIEAARLEAGPVLVPVLKGGRVQLGSAMSRTAAWKRVRYLAQQAGITRDVHPHLFRHGAVTQALDAGVPLHQVQDFARHADPRTTRRYDSHRMSLANPTAHVLAGRLAGVE